MYAQLQQKVELGGLSASTLNNYGSCIAKIALHFKVLPTELEEVQINNSLFKAYWHTLDRFGWDHGDTASLGSTDPFKTSHKSPRRAV